MVMKTAICGSLIVHLIAIAIVCLIRTTIFGIEPMTESAILWTVVVIMGLQICGISTWCVNHQNQKDK